MFRECVSVFFSFYFRFARIGNTQKIFVFFCLPRSEPIINWSGSIFWESVREKKKIDWIIFDVHFMQIIRSHRHRCKCHGKSSNRNINQFQFVCRTFSVRSQNGPAINVFCALPDTKKKRQQLKIDVWMILWIENRFQCFIEPMSCAWAYHNVAVLYCVAVPIVSSKHFPELIDFNWNW